MHVREEVDYDSDRESLSAPVLPEIEVENLSTDFPHEDTNNSVKENDDDDNYDELRNTQKNRIRDNDLGKFDNVIHNKTKDLIQETMTTKNCPFFISCAFNLGDHSNARDYPLKHLNKDRQFELYCHLDMTLRQLSYLIAQYCPKAIKKMTRISLYQVQPDTNHRDRFNIRSLGTIFNYKKMSDDKKTLKEAGFQVGSCLDISITDFSFNEDQTSKKTSISNSSQQSSNNIFKRLGDYSNTKTAKNSGASRRSDHVRYNNDRLIRRKGSVLSHHDYHVDERFKKRRKNQTSMQDRRMLDYDDHQGKMRSDFF